MLVSITGNSGAYQREHEAEVHPGQDVRPSQAAVILTTSLCTVEGNPEPHGEHLHLHSGGTPTLKAPGKNVTHFAPVTINFFTFMILYCFQHCYVFMLF